MTYKLEIFYLLYKLRLKQGTLTWDNTVGTLTKITHIIIFELILISGILKNLVKVQKACWGVRKAHSSGLRTLYDLIMKPVSYMFLLQDFDFVEVVLR